MLVAHSFQLSPFPTFSFLKESHLTQNHTSSLGAQMFSYGVSIRANSQVPPLLQNYLWDQWRSLLELALVNVLQRNKPNRRYIWQFIIMSCLTRLWKPRSPSTCHFQASGILQSESEGLRTKGANTLNFSPMAGEYWCPKLNRQKTNQFSFLLPFVLFRSSTDWIRSTCIGKGTRLYWVH